MYNEITANKRKSIFLITIFIAIILALGWWISWYFDGSPAILGLSAVIAVSMSLVSYYQGDKVALSMAGAKQISQQDNPYVYRLVENLCISMGLPMPKVHVIQDPALNAFATGRDPQHSSIALTTGIVEALENEELEGVIAHELSHIKNYDIRLGTIVIICVGFVAVITDMALRSMWFSSSRRSDSDRGNAGGILMLIGIVLMILAPIISELIKLAVSRKREFLADASGALATRYPEGLARALEKIEQSQVPLRSASQATAHLYISNPFKTGSLRTKASSLFSTHPPLAERIRRLRQLT